MHDLELAKQLLKSDPTLTCVLCCGDIVYQSTKKGIAPMMEFLDAELDMRGFCAADRVVGKAAALLFVLAGVREVYTEVLSEGGLRVLKEHGVLVTYEMLIPHILNRRGDGLCPMENAVREIEDAAAAHGEIRKTLAALRAKQ